MFFNIWTSRVNFRVSCLLLFDYFIYFYFILFFLKYFFFFKKKSYCDKLLETLVWLTIELWSLFNFSSSVSSNWTWVVNYLKIFSLIFILFFFLIKKNMKTSKVSCWAWKFSCFNFWIISSFRLSILSCETLFEKKSQNFFFERFIKKEKKQKKKVLWFEFRNFFL